MRSPGCPLTWSTLTDTSRVRYSPAVPQLSVRSRRLDVNRARSARSLPLPGDMQESTGRENIAAGRRFTALIPPGRPAHSERRPKPHHGSTGRSLTVNHPPVARCSPGLLEGKPRLGPPGVRLAARPQTVCGQRRVLNNNSRCSAARPLPADILSPRGSNFDGPFVRGHFPAWHRRHGSLRIQTTSFWVLEDFLVLSPLPLRCRTEVGHTHRRPTDRYRRAAARRANQIDNIIDYFTLSSLHFWSRY